jgi:hypothetical protein
MTSPALRIVPTVDDIRDRMGDLPRIPIPRLEDIGRQADETVDRLRGRPARPFWLRPVLVIGFLGVIAAIGAVAMSWSRGRSGRWADEDAIDRLDRISESGGQDGSPSMDSSAIGGFTAPSLTSSGGVAMDDREAEVR